MKFFFVITLMFFCCLPLATPRLLANPKVEKSSLAAREVQEEADPRNELACFSMGRMTIEYSTGEPGLPQAAFRVADPRGREIAYDPKTNAGQQEIPLAVAYLDCDENEETGELRQCKDHIEICGPLSGTYRVELSPVQPGNYSIQVSALSERTRSLSGLDVAVSRTEMQGTTQGHEPALLSLHYSREPGTQITLSDETRHLANR